MKNRRSNVDARDDLRARGEKFLAAKGPDLERVPREDVQELVHDLQACQIELERQNEELRQAQETLIKARDRYATIYDFAPVAYFTLDPQGLIIEVNLTGAKLLGAPGFSLLAQRFIGFVTLEDHEKFRTHLKSIQVGGVSPLCELMLRPHQGPLIPVSLESLALTDAKGTVVQYLTVVRDITKRKQAEANLRKSEALYRLIVETANEGIWGIDADYQTTYVNPVMAEMLGCRVEEILGRPVSDFIFPEDLSDYDDRMAHLRQGLDGAGELRLKRKDGSELWAIISRKSLMDDRGRFQGSFAMLTDITPRRQAEEALRLAAHQWQATFDAMSDAICLMDLNCRILACNQAMATLAGQPLDEILGCHCYEILHGTSQPISDCPITVMRQSGQREEVVLPLKDRWVRMTVDPILDETGAPVGAVYRIADITRLKKSEEALRESEAHFRQLFESAADAIFLHDRGKIVEVNEQACRSLGYTREELLHLNITDLEVEIDQRKLLEAWNYKPAEDTFYGTHRRKDGSTFPVEIRSREFTAQGRTLRLAIVRDITAQREAEQAIRESEDRFRELFNHMRSGVAIYNVAPSGEKIIIKDFNRAAERIESIKKRAVLGKDVREVFPGAEAMGICDIILRVWRSGQPEHIPMAFYRDERLSGWRECFIFKLPSGEVVAMYEDITTRVHDVQALRQSRETLRVLLDATPAGVMLLDPQGMILAVNRVGAKFLGKTIKEVVGTIIFEHLPEEVVQTDKDYFEEIKRSRQPLSFEECRQGHDFVNYVHPILSTSAEVTGFAVLSVDITERKQAEEALRQSRETLRVLLDATSAGVCLLDPQGIILAANKELAQRLGKAVKEIVGTCLFEYLSSDLAQTSQNRMELIKNCRQPLRFEDNHDGRIFDVYVHPILSTSAEVTGFAVLSVDITERKQAEEALRQSRETLRALLDATPAAVVLLDPGAKILAANKVLAERLGKPFNEMIGTNIFDHMPAEVARTRQAHLEEVKRSGNPLVFEDSRDGFIMDNYIHPIFSGAGALVGFAVLSVDITARKQAEEALAQQAQFLQLLIDTIPIPIFYKDAAGRYLGCNQAFQDFYGLRKDQIVGNTVDCLGFHEQVEKYRQMDLELFRTPGVQSYEYAAQRGDGRKREVAINKATFLKADGIVGGLIGVQVDVTEFKEVQKELRALAAQLAEAEELERQHLARELHDEVGQALTAMGLNLTLLKTQMPQETATPLLNRLTDAVALVEKTGETIRNIMAELRPPVLDDYGLLSALRWYGAEFYRRTGIGVDVRGEEAIPRLSRPVELALFRIAQEALTNVAKHAAASEVAVSQEVEGETVRLIIVDNGVGFDQTRMGQPEGRYRWGLMNMSERAAAAGGRCHIDSEPGHGTRVVVEVSR